jgi:hypothetical protein
MLEEVPNEGMKVAKSEIKNLLNVFDGGKHILGWYQ